MVMQGCFVDVTKTKNMSFFAINLHKYKFITTFAEDNTKGRTA
jgi:hypothetical protein